MASNPWQSNIIGHDLVDPQILAAHPLNPRAHPNKQVVTLRAAIGDVGFIRSVTVNKRNGRIIDGHARVAEAIRQKVAQIEVEYVDLNPDQERMALLTLDPIAAMAEHDEANLEALIGETSTDEESLAALIAELAEDAGLVPDEEDADGPDDEPEEAERQLSVTVICADKKAQRTLLEQLQADGHIAVMSTTTLTAKE